MKLRVIVREDSAGRWGAPMTTFKTFDVPMTPELLVHLEGLGEPPPEDVTRSLVGAEVVE